MATLAACALGAVLAGLSPIDARADETPPPVNRIVPTRQPQQPAPTCNHRGCHVHLQSRSFQDLYGHSFIPFRRKDPMG